MEKIKRVEQEDRWELDGLVKAHVFRFSPSQWEGAKDTASKEFGGHRKLQRGLGRPVKLWVLYIREMSRDRR